MALKKYNYDPNTDYMAEMDKAVAGGDLESAAVYEQQRNQKITDMDAAGKNGRGHVTTDFYSQYLPGSETEPSEAYRSGYSEQIGALLDSLQKGSQFNYDFDADPQKAGYEKRAQGNFDNTLAQLSARTGGLASSYAGQASQQAYQDTMDDAYALLRSQAYNEWLNGRQDQYQMLGVLQGLDDTEYGRFADQRAYDYQLGRDSISDRRYDTEKAQAAQSEKAQLLAGSGNFSGYQNLYGLSDVQRAGLEEAYRRGDEEALAQLMAQYGMYDDYVRLLGGSSEQASKLNAAYAAANGGRSGGSSSGSSSGKSGSAATKPTLTAAQTLKAIEDGIINDTTRAAYEYYFGEAYGGSPDGSAAGAASKVGQAARKATGSQGTGGRTAAATEKMQGSDTTYQHAKAAMMTAREWEQEKHSGTGSAGAYDTYEDYVAAYNEWLQTLR